MQPNFDKKCPNQNVPTIHSTNFHRAGAKILSIDHYTRIGVGHYRTLRSTERKVRLSRFLIIGTRDVVQHDETIIQYRIRGSTV